MKKFYHKVTIVIFTAYMTLFVISHKVWAYSISNPQRGGGIIPVEPGQGGINKLESIGAIIINSLLFMCGFVAVAVIAYAGVRYITAGGDTAKAEKAKGQLIWALAGLIVISFSWLALKAVVDIFGRGGYSQINYPTVTY